MNAIQRATVISAAKTVSESNFSNFELKPGTYQLTFSPGPFFSLIPDLDYPFTKEVAGWRFHFTRALSDSATQKFYLWVKVERMGAQVPPGQVPPVQEAGTPAIVAIGLALVLVLGLSILLLDKIEKVIETPIGTFVAGTGAIAVLVVLGIILFFVIRHARK